MKTLDIYEEYVDGRRHELYARNFWFVIIIMTLLQTFLFYSSLQKTGKVKDDLTKETYSNH
jgi:hypothetical protein